LEGMTAIGTAVGERDVREVAGERHGHPQAGVRPARGGGAA
jgi:hypothetical protein